jgi:hypothetical protein
MQIQNSQSLSQHLASGGSLTLGKQGQLETQSASGRFFQKIGDAFRSLTSSGRAAIETRNAHLETAMAHMLRDNTLVNLSQTEISHPLTQTERNALAMRLGVAQTLNKFPEEARAAARNLGLELLRHQGLPERGNPAETRGKALEVMNKILGDEVVRNALRCNYARTHEELGTQLSEMSDHLRNAFMRQKDSLKENGMHQNYLKDAERHAVHTINGHPPNYADFENEFLELIPDPKFSGFLSMMASQAGLEAALTYQLQMPGKTQDNPDMPGFLEMTRKGLVIELPEHRYDIEVDGDKARVKLEINAILMATLTRLDGALGIDSHAPSGAHGKGPIGGGCYTFELVVDLTQNMEGQELPDFELVNASRKPLVIPPPVSIQPEG